MKYHPFNFKITNFYKGVKKIREPNYITISNKIEDNKNYCILITQRIKKKEALILGKRKSYLNIGDIFYHIERNIFYIYSLIKENESNGVKSVGFKRVLNDEVEKVIHFYDFLKDLNDSKVILKYIGNIFTDEGLKQIMFYNIKRYKKRNNYKTLNNLNKILELKKKRILDIYFILNIKNKKGVMSYTYDSIFHKPKLIKIIDGWDIVLSYKLKDNSYKIEENNNKKIHNYFYSTTGTLIHFDETKKNFFIKDDFYKDLFYKIDTDKEFNDLFYKTKDILVLLNENGKISYYSFLNNEFYLLNNSQYLFYFNCDLYEHINHLKNKEKFNNIIISLI